MNTIWKSKYTDIYYRVFGGSTKTVEMYDLENIWDVKDIKKTELRKHFEFIADGYDWYLKYGRKKNPK